MAKDKSTKKNDTKPAKASKPAKGKGAADEFAKPSEAPAGGDGWSLADDSNVGKLLIIKPLRTDKVSTEKYGEKEIIVADVVVVDEKKPAKSEEHENVFVFGAWLQGSLRAYIGERIVLARLVKEKDKSSGRGYVWKFEDADEDDAAKAREYLASLDPFDQKAAGGKKSKGKK